MPYLAGERSPVLDAKASGLFIGLRSDTTRAEMYLAVLEGVAFAIRQNYDLIKQSGFAAERVIICGGGVKSALWRRIFACVLNRPVSVSACDEGPAYGAALIAAVSKGIYPSVYALPKELFSVRETILPDKKYFSALEKRFEKYSCIYPAIKQLYKEPEIKKKEERE